MTTELHDPFFAGGAGRQPAAKALNFYSENYDAIFTRDLTPGSRCFLGARLPRLCRFCGQQRPAVRFRTEAHAISALTGNDVLFTYDECDDCNTRRFSSIEDDLGKFLMPARAFAQVSGRGGIPKVIIPGGRMEMRDSVLRVKVDRHAIDMTFKDDPTSHRLTVSVPLQPYRPLAVYKALLKMALTVAPADELDTFRSAMKWLSTDDIQQNSIADCFGFRCIRTYGAKVYTAPVVRLLRRKPGSDAPYATIILGFGGGTFQIFLPSDGKDAHLASQFVPMAFPPLQMIQGESADDWTKFEIACLSSPSKVKGAIWSIDLSYQRREAPPGTTDPAA